VLDCLLVGTQISWGLTGSFDALRRSILRDRLDAGDYRRLYEAPFEHGAPIIREGTDGEIEGAGAPADAGESLDPAFVDWLSSFEPPRGWGSNHWAVSGEHTDTGSPILAYDPHLTLMAPPLWYEQRITVGDVNVRGATVPGLPFVIVGETGHDGVGRPVRMGPPVTRVRRSGAARAGTCRIYRHITPYLLPDQRVIYHIEKQTVGRATTG